ncbi:JmjC domain-containing protein [Fodinicola acaciae]|uniref:JmjC domain-containing protein n=1 Tax=Fodinicola acaciae TaxID=2681555 RepID=UPI0013D1CA76|nr:cupin domain-containing protein [Fodinicola acaciae]
MESLDWDVFADRCWDRQPVLVRRLPRPPFEPHEVFQAAVLAGRPPRPDRFAPNAQFTVERRQQVVPGDFLPEPSDGSLAGYQKRVAELVGGRRYALILHAFHAFSYPQWQRERDFYAGLWQRVGQPLSGAITTMFHGTYEHSPVGVHKDRFATFMFGLTGRKRMRFWPGRPWSEEVSTVLDYQPYLAESFAVEVGPGELLYWPSSYYHVGESAGDGPATSVNVGVPRENHRASYDLDDLVLDLDPATVADAANALGQFPRPDAPLSVATADDALDDSLPPVFAEALSYFRTFAIDERTVDRSLRHRTAGGFRPVPPPEVRRDLPDTTTVRRAAELVSADGLCAANGHTVRLVPATAAVVDRLRADEPVRVADLPESDRAAARRLLETLETFRAVRRGA